MLATVGFVLCMFHRLAPAPTWWSPSCKEPEIQQSLVAETTAHVALDANSDEQWQDWIKLEPLATDFLQYKELWHFYIIYFKFFKDI